MRKWIPIGLTALLLLWMVSTLRPAAKPNGFDAPAFSQLPVLLNGRIQPLDSVARNSLLQLRGRQTVLLEDRKSMPAREWLMEMLMKPEAANNRKAFRIDHPEVLSLMKLSREEKFFAFNQMTNSLPDLGTQAERLYQEEMEKNRDPKLRSVFEKQVDRLYKNLVLYQRLQHSLLPEGVDDFSKELERYVESIPAGVAAIRAQQAGEEYDRAAFDRVLGYLGIFQRLGRMSYPLMTPPTDPERNRDGWTPIGTNLMDVARGNPLHPAIKSYAAMTTAFRANQPAQFNAAVTEYQNWLKKDFSPELAKGKREYFFNHLQPFYKSTILYFLGFMAACLYWFVWKPEVRASAFNTLLLAFVIHTVGLIFRMVLEGRPPVTNLYSSAIFVGWGAVVLGLVLERFYRDGIGSMVAAVCGFLTQIIAHNLAVGGDTMEMLEAVLDTNFWLATHVVIVTLGYASTFVAGFLGIVFILRGFFSRSLSATTSRTLYRMMYGIVCFATLFSFVGTMLGGIWADQSWGRFWGWDPKENGALIIVLWNALILHARWGGMIRERGMAVLTVFGNIVTGFSWFGVNMLGVGLHSYGFMDKAFYWLMLFTASQLILMGIGIMPLRFWSSFRNPPPSAPPSSGLPKGKMAASGA